MAAPTDYCYICKWWSHDTSTCDYCYRTGCSRHPEISPCMKFDPRYALAWSPETDARLMDAYVDGATDTDLRRMVRWSEGRVITWRAYHGFPRNDNRKREDTYE